MFPPNNITNLLVTLISKYIYHNRTKLNLLSTCKFIYNISNIHYYQEVKIDTEQKIKNEFTNICLNLNHSCKPNNLVLNFKLFNNITCLTINYSQELHDGSLFKIESLPSRLKILNVEGTVIINIGLPPTLEILFYAGYGLLSLNRLINLKKLTIGGNLFEELPVNLKYLKFLSWVDPNKISHINKIKNLKTLIFYENNIFNSSEYNPLTFAEIFNPEIKHLSLVSAFYRFPCHKLKQIIPKNITHLEIYKSDHTGILCEYPLLTKLTLKYVADSRHDEHLQKISSNITSICTTLSGAEYLLPIFKNINYLTIYGSSGNTLRKILPENITRLKIHNLAHYKLLNDSDLLQNIQELCINSVSFVNKIVHLNSNLKKLKIKYNDRYRFIYNDECEVTYIY